MDLTISQAILAPGLQKIQGIIPRKPMLPILSHFLLTAAADSVIIQATDLELGYRTSLDAQVHKPGSVALPARKVYDILRLIPAAAEVRLTALDAPTGWVQMRADTATFKLACLSAEEFPTLPQTGSDTAYEVDSAVLDDMIRKTVFATVNDETRYVLSGVLLDCNDKGTTMVATDGHRLPKINHPSALAPPQTRLVVPKKALYEVLRFADEPSTELTLDGNHLAFRRGESVLTTRLIEGRFPSYQMILPTSFTRKAEVQHETLLRALRQVTTLSDEKVKRVKFEFEPEAMTLTCQAEGLGQATCQIPVTYTGEPMAMGFNARYLLEALGVMADPIVLEMTDPKAPGLMRSPSDDRYVCVIMPMHV